MRLIFMGTPEFSAAFLDYLLRSDHEVVAVVTQPDRPAGRGRVLTAPPVKTRAEQAGLRVLQPLSLRDEWFIGELRALRADAAVVVAFSILPREVLETTRCGAVNVHGSLLPLYRGAAPVQWAIADGCEETGVTVFLLDEKMDHGPILVQRRISIGPEDTAEDVLGAMIPVGCNALDEALRGLENNAIQAVPQDHAKTTPARKLRKEDGLVNWNLPARVIKNRQRGFYPWPGAYSFLQGRLVHFHRVGVVPEDAQRALDPGEVLITRDERLLVGTGEGCLELLVVQAQGRKVMSAADFIRGLPRMGKLVFTDTGGT